MGLDITAYSKLEKVDCVFNADGEPIHPESRLPLRDDYFQAHVNSDFPDRAGSIEDSAIYRYKRAIPLHAGSYMGYNQWREQLAELAGYPLVEYERWGQKWPSHAASTYDRTEGPFWELIHFSDCEGIIGPEASAKIARDFADHQAKADTHEDEWFRSKYNEWRAAFELAAQNGAVHFH